MKKIDDIKDDRNEKRLGALEELVGSVKTVADDKFAGSSGNFISMVGRTEEGQAAVKRYEEKNEQYSREAGSAVHEAHNSHIANTFGGDSQGLETQEWR